MRRNGFALLAVLWVIAALSAVVGVGLASLRVEAGASGNRLELTRGRWAADACLAIAQARWVTQTLRDTATVDLGRGTRCAWRVDDPTARVNVNTAPPAVLERLGVQLGVPQDEIDTILAHRPYQDTAQLRPLTPDARSLAFLTTDGPGTIDLNRAPPEVIMAIAGLGSEVLERLEEYRQIGRPLSSLDQLSSSLSSGGPDLLANYADLSASVTFAPPQLLITAIGWVGQNGDADLHATIEELVVPLPDRLAVIRRRLW